MKQVKESPRKDVDILIWCSRAAMELIGQGALGYSLDPLVSNTPTPYGMTMKSFEYVPFLSRISLSFILTPWISSALNALSIGQFFLPYFRNMGPRWLRGWLFKLIPSARTKRILHVVDTMDSESRKIYNAKKTALEAEDDTILHQVGEGKDIMSILRACALYKNHAFCSLGAGFESLTSPQCKQT